MVCFAAAEQALQRVDVASDISRALSRFADRYPAVGRTPAGDQLDAVTGYHAPTVLRQETL
ncbi:hypothetical protein ACFZAR_18790 [Streptomyces sp. NPDC008222]|uniref:hypothetical protein n=1 Tax=Streptomyces sp. NPDC008222 TaxID=3364820 RepID=UPI0036E5947A